MHLARFAPITGVLGLAAVNAGLIMDNLPGGKVTDRDLTTYTQTHGWATWLFMGVAIGVGGALLLVFTGVLVGRLAAAGASPVAIRVAQTAGGAWATLTLAAGAVWAAPPIAHMFLDANVPSAAIFTTLGGLAYGMLLIFNALAAAVLAATVTAVALRTEILPRWLAVAGIPASLLILANPMLPMVVVTLWFVAVAICLMRRAATSVPSAASTALAGATV